jgi:hypothetical protein
MIVAGMNPKRPKLLPNATNTNPVPNANAANASFISLIVSHVRMG